MKIKLSACFVLSLIYFQATAQPDSTVSPTLKIAADNKGQDTSSLSAAFKRGKVHGDFRYYFMTTHNDEGLSDYYANAASGAVHYQTASFKGFQFAVASSFIYNIGSSDLTQNDPKTGAKNRYEAGLFDAQDLSNKNNMYRLEELYLKYGWKKSYISIGKQSINTPFLNPQDGRMRPGFVEGIWAEINELKNTKIEAGFIYGMSPRSTTHWFRVEETFGIYSTGVNPDGTKSGYAGNTSSAGIGLLGVTQKLNKNLSVQFWDVWVQQVFNTAMLQADYRHDLRNKSTLIASAQYVYQSAISDGGNADPGKTYFQKSGMAQTFGLRTGWENERWQTSLNYNRITADGRFLMPREWGREPFFTFIIRERNEGLGDVSAYTIKAAYKFTRQNFKTQLSVGYFDLPDVNNTKLNKYGLPSYTHLAAEMQYKFKGFLEGLDAQLIYAYKLRVGDVHSNDKYVINKVNMSNFAVVVNYRF